MMTLEQTNLRDQAHMHHAIELARRGLGSVSPNPPVGCVIVAGDQIVGEGWHEKYGGPHAEPNALARAGEYARGATAYVTLCPCAHHGKTPPCTDALIRAGVSRVVVAVDDPNPTSGSGVQILRDAGIQVDVGLLAEDAAEVMQGFLKFIETGLPFVTLKYAMTLDGRIATTTGDSKWISCEESRQRVQKMRSRSDAILVGIGTAVADDPRLNVRDPDLPQPKRVVVDAFGRLSPKATMFQEPGGEIVLLSSEKVHEDWVGQMQDTGSSVLRVAEKDGHVDLRAAMKKLGALGVRNILCEGGAGLAGGLMKEKLVDAVAVFIAPTLVGDGLAPIVGSGLLQMKDALKLTRVVTEMIGCDQFVTGRIIM